MKTYEEMADSVIRRIKENELISQKRKKRTCRLACIITVICILSLMGINTVIPSYARGLPVIGGIFAYIQDNLDFSGNYSDYAKQLDIPIDSNGTLVTLSDVYCDGLNLYVSFIVESSCFQKLKENKDCIDTQLDYVASSYAYDDSEIIKLPDFGIRGLEGRFIDERTFAGVETYSLSDRTFPEDFRFHIDISSFSMIGQGEKKISGNWKFDVDVKTDHSDIVTYEIGEENEGHSIDKVVVSPIMITVFTSYPDIYGKTVRYHVSSFSDISPMDEVSVNGEYGDTSGITRIPRNHVEKELYIYIYDSAALDAEDRKTYRERVEDKAIVKTIITLQ